MRKKTVLLIEPGLGGHRPIYLDAIVKFFKLNDWSVKIGTVPKNLEDGSIYNLCNSISGDVEVFSESLPKFWWDRFDASSGIIFWLHARILYRNVLKKSGTVDLVFVPYLDNFFAIVSLLGSPFGATKFSGITMRQSFHFSDIAIDAPRSVLKDYLKKVIFHRFVQVNGLKNLYAIDRTFVEYVSQKGGAVKLRCLPDPVEDFLPVEKYLARNNLGLSISRKILLVYGGIDARKGVLELLDAYRLFDRKDEIQIVIAGRQSPDVVEPIKNRIVSICSDCPPRVMNLMISSEEEMMLLSAADAVWLGYRNHYTMSGILVKAVMANLPVIGSRQGLIGYYMEKYSLGVGVDIDCVDSIDSALSALLDNVLSGHADQCVLKFNTWENAYNVLSADLF